jgi:CheY-like chemotaxis protein
MRRLQILHVEDVVEDATLLERACQMASLPADFHAVRQAADAMQYLKGEGEFADRDRFPYPDVIVLDLQMTEMNGFEFLRWLRDEEKHREVPVLVFTVSARPEDKQRALAEGAAGFFVKPQDFDALVRMAESFKHWDRGKFPKGDGVSSPS